MTVSLNSMLLMFFAASLSVQGVSAHADSTTLAPFVKKGPPPCAVDIPNEEFMSADAKHFSVRNIESAAWFARQVQLTSGLRSAAWKSLSKAPLRVQEFELPRWGLHAVLFEFEQHVLVVYRGTEDVLDYVLNAAFYTTRKGRELGLPGWVHEGFFINFKLSWEKLFGAIQASASGGKTVTFAAHSLGGALSQFAAWILEERGIRVNKIYAFQSPNAGDVEFQKEFELRFGDKHINTLYGDDVTPHIPPVLEAADSFARAVVKPLGGVLGRLIKAAHYSGIGQRYIVNRDGSQILIPSESVNAHEVQYWDSYLEKSGGKPFPLSLSPDSSFIVDHDMDNVLCTLTQLH
jgi:hypothetical protein